jgi:mannose-6-phosphate isomerase-like protein (cupin superfamily)
MSVTPLYAAAGRTEFPTAERCHITELFNRADFPLASIAQARVEPGVTTANHRLHDTDEWYYILRGRGQMFLDGRLAGAVGPGDVVHIPAGRPQYIANDGADDLVFLCFCVPGFRDAAYEAVDSV